MVHHIGEEHAHIKQKNIRRYPGMVHRTLNLFYTLERKDKMEEQRLG